MPGTGVPVFVFMGHVLGGTHRQVGGHYKYRHRKYQVLRNHIPGQPRQTRGTSEGFRRKRSAEGWEERAGAAGRGAVFQAGERPGEGLELSHRTARSRS